MPDHKKTQKRKTISFPPDVFDVIAEHAGKETKSIAQFVIEKLRAAGVPIPETTHMEYAASRKAIRSREKNRAMEAEYDATARR